MNDQVPALPTPEPPAGGPPAARLARLLAAGTDEARLDALVELIRSLSGPGAPSTLFDALERDRALGAAVRAQTGALLAAAYPVSLLAETGLPTQRGFLAELGSRVSERLVPRPRDGRHLADRLPDLAPALADGSALRTATPGERLRLASALLPPAGDPAWDRLAEAFADAFRLLALRVESIGLAPEFRQRGTGGRVTGSPFFRFGRASEALLTAFAAGEGVDSAAAAWRDARAACGEEMGVVRRRLGALGIRVDIVFGMESIARALARMNLMVRLATARTALERSELLFDLLAQLARAARDDRSVHDLLSRNLSLLHRRIVDRSGTVGEHYIAEGRREYGLIWLLAAGGGVVAALIAIAKTGIHGLPLPPFLLGLAYGLAYTAGFLLMQRFDLILATKQPAMTAATLAGAMRETRGEGPEKVARLAARITSSQLAAAASNVLLVIVAAYGFEWSWSVLRGRPLIPPEEALEIYRKYSPLDSLTALYAAETGVILWLASLAGGWFDNWTALHEVPEGIAQRWGRVVGTSRARRWADGLRRGAGGFGTNVALGFMLGLVPEIGRFLGLPLDARHVTLSTGQLALAASALGYDWFLGGWFLRALAGIAAMFVLNLTVSFLLSLYTAARALDMPARAVGEVLWQIALGVVRHPLRFLLPVPWR